MTQLISPSAALSNAFVLPKIGMEPSKSQPQADIVSGYGFTVDTLGLLLPSTVASRLVDIETRVCRLPTAPGWLLGMMNLSGSTVALFDLDAMLDLPGGRAATHYLVIGEGADAAAVGIGERPQRIRLSADQRMTRGHPLPGALQPYVQACYRDTDRVWVEWDFRAFFDAAAARL